MMEIKKSSKQVAFLFAFRSTEIVQEDVKLIDFNPTKEFNEGTGTY